MAPAQQGVFRGDGEGMVEALIRACERKPVATSACAELFGRELVPWTDESVQSCLLDQPLETGNRHAQAGSKFPSASHKHARQPGRVPESPEHKKAGCQAKRTKVGTTPARAVPQAAASSRRASSEGPRSFACPAVAASPKPENLPMPTTGLMNRALVRGRSPSPVKDATFGGGHSFFTLQGQQLVRVAA